MAGPRRVDGRRSPDGRAIDLTLKHHVELQRDPIVVVRLAIVAPDRRITRTSPLGMVEQSAGWLNPPKEVFGGMRPPSFASRDWTVSGIDTQGGAPVC